MAALEISLARGDEPVDAKVFFETAGEVIDLVQRAERNIGGRQQSPARWALTELRVGSAVAVASPVGEESDRRRACEASMRLVEGLNALESSATIPPAFDVDMLRSLLRVARGHEVGNEVRISSSADGGKHLIQASVAARTIQHAKDALAARKLEFDSVQGEIDRLDVRGSKREVSIFDIEQNRSVRATFPPELLADVLRNIKQRVAAWGLAQRTAAGQTVAFEIEKLEPLADRPIMPVREIAGIAPWWTDGEDPTEWVRGQRAGE
ncbi:hypothetical protein HNR23_004054 [Nocardiopsis mwathae]|uniref:Uncharacterized protein n=1 Tax=Nocardiopsis mwathae TaxID=1472723 RepID=A0A7W9YKT7_9ACTN|nr:hypothetical protein [Nocardiopsis mwathae]MBB6173994.1 hypothetical protein [Nocardiopsis mwathae]